MKRLAPLALLTVFIASVAVAELTSRNQRRCIMTMGQPSMPQSDGSLDSGDRAQLIGIFRGQLEPEITSTGSTSSGGCLLQWLRRRR